MVLWGCPPPLRVPPGFLRPSGGARHRKAGSSSPWWSLSSPSSTTLAPPPPGGGPHPSQGPGPCPSPGPRAGPPLPLAAAPPAALCLRRRRRAPPSPGRGHPRRLRSRCGGGWLVLGSWGFGGDEFSGVWVDVVEVGVVVVVVVGAVRRHLFDAGGHALKRYPEPMAHGPEACEPAHPSWPMARRPVSHHTRAEAVETGCQRDIPVL